MRKRMAAVLLCVAVVFTLLPVAFGPVSVAKASAAAGTDDTFATFNGSTYFRVADNSAFDITGNLTVSAWVRPNSTCLAASVCANCSAAREPARRSPSGVSAGRTR